MTAFFNTGLSQHQFLAEYWQKKPLIIKQAFNNFSCPISPEELAGLACEPEIESRLIIDADPWVLRHGPFNEQDFARLPSSHWTLLVQDVEKHVPELAELLTPFNFIPDWRRDDLMISYAVESGSVGAHTDGYDVFLLQGSGKRKWQFSNKPVEQPQLIEQCELSILKEFDFDQEWIVEPGDILYLPPHFAHYGVALESCMTLSIGFRAPQQVELADSLVDSLLEQQLGQQHYRDLNLLPCQDRYHIDNSSLEAIKQSLYEMIDEAEPLLIETLGKWASQTKPSLSSFLDEQEQEIWDKERVTRHFEKGYYLVRNRYLRLAWSYSESGEGRLFLAGECYRLDEKISLQQLAESECLQRQDWDTLRNNTEAVNIIISAIERGFWLWQPVDDKV